MKKLLLLLALLFVPIICSAQTPKECNKCEYRVRSGKSESLSFDEYDSYVSKAITNPDKKIFIEKSEKIFKLKLLFKAKVEVTESIVTYDSRRKIIHYFDIITTKEETSYLILFGVLSLILMATSNILFKKSYTRFAFFVVSIISILATLAAVVVLAFTSSGFAIFTNFIVVAVAAAISTAFIFSTALVAEVKYKIYKISSIIFYIAMAVGMILLFI